MERLRHDDDVSAGRIERDRLRSTLHGSRLRNSSAEMRNHLGQRLDRGHPVSQRNERPRQLACPGTQVDDVTRLVTHEPPHRILGIAGASSLIGLRDLAKRARPRLTRFGLHLPILRRVLRRRLELG